MPANEVLIRYVTTRLQRKEDPAKIRQTLLTQGWQQADVEAAMEAVLPKPVQSSQQMVPVSGTAFGLSLAGGLGGLILSLSALLNGSPIFIPQLGSMGSLLGLIFSILVIVAAGLILKGRERIGGLVVLILAAVLLFIGTASIGIIFSSIAAAAGGASGLAE